MFGKLKQILGGKEPAWNAISTPVLHQIHERIDSCFYRTPYTRKLLTELLRNSAILTKYVILDNDIVKTNVHSLTSARLQMVYYRTLEMFVKMTNAEVEAYVIRANNESQEENPDKIFIDALERIFYPAKPDHEWMDNYCVAANANCLLLAEYYVEMVAEVCGSSSEYEKQFSQYVNETLKRVIKSTMHWMPIADVLMELNLKTAEKMLQFIYEQNQRRK
jgi:hypothetical protein